MDDAEKRRKLLAFLDDRVFRPVLDSLPRQRKEASFLREAQKRVRRTWARYPERYQTAATIKQAFLSDLQSPIGQELAELLRWLGLPRFEDIKADFLELCRECDV